MNAKWVKDNNRESWDLIHGFYELDEGHKEHNYGWVEKQEDGWVAEHPIHPVDEDAPDCKRIGVFPTLLEAQKSIEKENPPPPCFGGEYI